MDIFISARVGRLRIPIKEIVLYQDFLEVRIAHCIILHAGVARKSIIDHVIQVNVLIQRISLVKATER